jgi:hypothetical protein
VTSRYAPRNLQGLPTLTEVIEVGPPEMPVATATPPVEAPGTPRPAVGAEPGDADSPVPALAEPAIDEERLVGNVLLELQRHADLMLEYRLREAIDPALARLADGLVRDLREELAATLRDVVARAVSQELARRRGRQA